MEPKIAQFGNRGMQQDTSISKSSNEFAYENRNIRITAVNNDTLLSITNEKGPKAIDIKDSSESPISLEGIYLGHCIVGKYVVLFTKGNNDYIYRLEDKGEYFEGQLLASGLFNFSLSNPIEAIGYYESEDIQKVYWVDGINQPRYINIIRQSNSVITRSSLLDFVSTVDSFPLIQVQKEYGGQGIFPSGVIQYFITYYNKFGAETAIVAASGINYITFSDRGGKADENINCLFKLIISGIDSNFDYLRVYSAKRTTINGPIEVQIVSDVLIKDILASTVEVVDTNINQALVDSNILYYLGGEEFIASTLEQKDNTLFLGSLKLKNTTFPDISYLPAASSIYENNTYIGTINNQFYHYDYQLKEKSSEQIKYFKGGETYRFGIQFLNNKGKWSPIKSLGDYTVPLSSRPSEENGQIKIPMLNYSGTTALLGSEWIGYRILRAETSANTRRTLAQGMVNPTVFNYEERCNNAPYAISSWIARPRMSGNFSHMQSITSPVEIQNLDTDVKAFEDTSVSTVYKIVVLMNSKVQIGTDRRLLRVFGVTENVSSLTELTSGNTELLHTALIYQENWNKALDEVDKNLKAWGYDFRLSSGMVVVVPKERRYTSSDEYQEYNMASWAPLSIGTLEYSGYDDYWCMYYIDKGIDAGFNGRPDKHSTYFIDSSIVTLNSPELQSTQTLLENENIKFRIVGLIPIHNSFQKANVEIGAGTSVNAKAISNYSQLDDAGETLLSAKLYRDGLLVSEYKNKGTVDETVTHTFDTRYLANYDIYMWHKTGSVIGVSSEWSNADECSSATLNHKIFATERYSGTTKYFNTPYNINICTPKLSSATELTPTKIEVPTEENNNGYVYFYNNYDRLSVSEKEYHITVDGGTFEETTDPLTGITTEMGATELKITDPVRIKYKSTPSAVFSLGMEGNDKLVLPELISHEEWDFAHRNESIDGFWQYWVPLEGGAYNESIVSNFPWNDSIRYIQRYIQNLSEKTPYLYIGELYRDLTDPYGNDTDDVNEKLRWIPCSETTSLGNTARLEGDTYYQRWDCLKTYPFTEEDENSVVDITSFMVESHINLDGRCDVNRGGTEITSYRPDKNFNLMNDVYSQENNIFEYNILDEKYDLDTFKNQITWSLTKNPEDDIDTWTHITMLNLLSLDGTYGAITKLSCINNALFAFQDRAISRINYNDRMQISTEQNTPIEVQNSGKVQGYTYISKQIGCKNKWSICQSTSGIYFTDTEKKSLYRINSEGLNDVSVNAGMSMWFKKNISNNPWTADWLSNKSAKTSYDAVTNDIYVSTDEDCIVYNEGLQAFTSFMPYKKTPLLFSLDSKSLMIDENTGLYQMFAGEYNKDKDGNPIGYSIKYRINPEPLETKTFTNLELIADYTDNNNTLLQTKPFSTIETWNEHQYGKEDLEKQTRYFPSDIKNKFRVWRINIPRDKTNSKYGLDRMKNPWIFLKLNKEFEEEAEENLMTFHSLLVKYFK